MIDVELSVVVVVALLGATAGRPLTGLTLSAAAAAVVLDALAAAAGTALKRMLGTTEVEREVEEALSSTMVLTTVFWTVV